MPKRSEKGKVKSEKSVENQIVSAPRRNKRFLWVILIIGLLLLAYYKKSWFIAATVNNQPITALELNERMGSLYKEKVLSQMTNEKILEQEAAKKRLSVNQSEIDTKASEVETQYGGKESFESLLKQQGLIRDEFLRQIKFQLMVEKLYSGDATASAEEVQKFMDENKNSPEATDEAKFKELAEKSIKQDRLSQIFNEKFTALKQSAKIQIF